MSCKPTWCILFYVVTCDYRAWNEEIIPFVLRVHQRTFRYLIYSSNLRYVPQHGVVLKDRRVSQVHVAPATYRPRFSTIEAILLNASSTAVDVLSNPCKDFCFDALQTSCRRKQVRSFSVSTPYSRHSSW